MVSVINFLLKMVYVKIPRSFQGVGVTQVQFLLVVEAKPSIIQ